MVRVLAIADEEAPVLDPACLRDLALDLVLAAGDLPWDYLEYVASAIDAPVAFVPGNHDPATSVGDGILRDARRPMGVTNADGAVIELAGLRIAGLGGCVRYRPGPHQYTQRQYVRRARRLAWAARRAGPVDVLVTHAPPLGLGDGDDPAHEGIEALHRLLERLRPSYHLHGHVHPYGRERPDRSVGRTAICNVIPFRVLEIDPVGQPSHA